MMSKQPMDEATTAKNQILDDLFLAYRETLPDFEPGAAFMPAVWAGIEAREKSTNWFGRAARLLAMSAVAASLVLGLLVAGANKPAVFFNGTFIDALYDDHVAELEPLHLDRMSQLERQ
jgi:hypothetical protein